MVGLALVATTALPVNAARAASTSVSGIIASSTTWTRAGSPYVVTGTVQIAHGATLTVEPGVVVESSSGSIQVFGGLNAAGTSLDKVTFNSVAIEPAATTPSQPCRIELRYCVLNGGTLYAPNGDPAYGGLVLTDSRIEYPTSYCYI